MKQPYISFFFLSSFALASTVFADVAHAGRYELIKGKGVEVCRRMRGISIPSALRRLCCASVLSVGSIRLLQSRYGKSLLLIK